MTESIVINFANASEYNADVIGKYIHLASLKWGLPVKFTILSYKDDGLATSDSNKQYNRIVEDVYVVENLETTYRAPYNSLSQVALTIIKNESGERLIEVVKRKDLVETPSTPHTIPHADVFVKLLGVRATVTMESFFEDAYICQPYLSRSKVYSHTDIENDFYLGYYTIRNLDAIYGSSAPLDYKKNGTTYFNTTYKKLLAKSGEKMVDTAGRETTIVTKNTISKLLNSINNPVFILINITGILALFELRNKKIIKVSGDTLEQRDHFRFYKDANGGLYLHAVVSADIGVTVFGLTVASVTDFQDNVSGSGLTYLPVYNTNQQTIGYNADNGVPTFGSTRPTFNTGSVDSTPNYVGFMFFDTTLGKPIWWNGSAWVDATGATV